MTPTEYLLDIREIFLPELWEEDNQMKLTKLKGILQFSELKQIGLSIWDDQLNREDRYLLNSSELDGRKAWFLTTKYYNEVYDLNTWMAGAETHIFNEPARSALWIISHPKNRPELLTFSIFEVY
ncbi:MAG: hypothetical protein KME59_21475 [Trichormus sp. ATA11-4-KO1]|jgi:hypothetical protein|nr:hypothetical protein [Trichormus sp. ATA11-4-KO1]